MSPALRPLNASKVLVTGGAGFIGSATVDELLRTGVGYSLSGNDAALTRMQQRYGGFYDQARNPEALRVALSGVQTGQLSVADFGRATADNEAFAGWVDKMKARFREKPAPVGAAKPAPVAKQAAAATAAKG